MIDLQKIGEWLAQNIVQIIIILSIFIQITPIKLNPWTSLFKWIGKVITEDSNKNIQTLIMKTNQLENFVIKVRDDMNLETTNIQNQINENEKDRIRWEILDFANSCRNKREHTKDEFQHIITLNDKYKELLEKTKDKNGVFETEYNYILNLYNKLLENDNFLTAKE